MMRVLLFAVALVGLSGCAMSPESVTTSVPRLLKAGDKEMVCNTQADGLAACAVLGPWLPCRENEIEIACRWPNTQPTHFVRFD